MCERKHETSTESSAWLSANRGYRGYWAEQHLTGAVTLVTVYYMYCSRYCTLNLVYPNTYLKLLYFILDAYMGISVCGSKTKFMVISGTAQDREPIKLADVSLEWCIEYVYLGAYFSCGGKIRSALARQCQENQCQVFKFVRFLDKNRDFPFWVYFQPVIRLVSMTKNSGRP